jgi:tetratricopeptide (TPR) repeat protein
MTHPRAFNRVHRTGGLRAGLAAALVAGAIVTCPAPAAAQTPTPASDAARAMQLNEAGSELYASGKYAAALQAFQRAYSLLPEPNLLFNIAGCHERLGQRQQAIEYYRWFLGTASANPEGRRRAISTLARLEAQPSGPAPIPPAPPRSAEETSNSAAWPLATLGAGILFAGLGAGLYLDGAHDHNEVTNAPGFGDATGSSTLTEVEAKKLIDSGDTKKRIGVIGFGLGGALIATHVAINLWRGATRDSSQTSAELRLSPGGWAVAGKF